MKNRILKALASFGLSVCVLAGSSVVSMAEETPGQNRVQGTHLEDHDRV